MTAPRPPWANPAYLVMRGLLVVVALVVAVGAFAAGRPAFGVVFLVIAVAGVVLLVASRRIR